jgi:hypothetical protein
MECHGVDADTNDIHGEAEKQASTNTIISASLSVTMSSDTLKIRTSKYYRSRPEEKQGLLGLQESG